MNLFSRFVHLPSRRRSSKSRQGRDGRPSVRPSSLFPAEGGLPSSILSYTSSEPKAVVLRSVLLPSFQHSIVPLLHSSLYLFIPLLILSLSIIHAPSFLLISEAPVKADAVVLFLGGEKGAREKEAEQLLREGFADYLIIPATGQIKKQGPAGNPVGVDFDSKHVTSNLKLGTSSWFENTHIEVLGAKRLMENLGLCSALFVSSPYHMRRIKMRSFRL